MALIVGLGNPGLEYKGTRHNVGFELIDNLSEKLTITLQQGNGLFFFGEGQFKGRPVALLKPTTYMNNSGKAVSKALALTGNSPQECIICYDDIHLEIGRIKLKPSGSAGGHNGMIDIIERLQTRDFPRLRIGIGNDFKRGRQSEYVLSPFTSSQRNQIDETLEVASNAILTFLRGGIEAAMNQFN
ncbi:aminoacyl-tRNA hydrolase [Rhodohalobacter sp. 614A]|uniref:aminoacyl-tRNA hydrolase n=1 Tax=Rhodohalobacter sp. 614A TaxID=2908649 RepID=UPI001F3D5C61|nr:aminoacyl-tRNA hydrolase [Rhodohalobacter sp. 614A]